MNKEEHNKLHKERRKRFWEDFKIILWFIGIIFFIFDIPIILGFFDVKIDSNLLFLNNFALFTFILFSSSHID